MRPAAAEILVNISKSSQRMAVLVDGTARYTWLISTGSARYTTPNGVYRPQWLARKWRSRKYGNAPMPHSVFFHNGYAIHGTTEIARLGKSASHGCVRLHPENAAKLYALVQKEMAETRIVVSNDAIDAPGEPPKKPSLLVADNTVSERSLAAARIEPTELVVPESLPVSEKTGVARQAPKTQARPIQAREAKAPALNIRTVFRTDRLFGFRW